MSRSSQRDGGNSTAGYSRAIRVGNPVVSRWRLLSSELRVELEVS
ncbi:hypothetical protein [Halomontanus rarus]